MPVFERLSAESELGLPTWGLLLAALTFEPETTTPERLQVRGPYTAADAYLTRLAAGRPPQGENAFDLETWNQAHVEARRAQNWEAVWADLQAAHGAFLEALEDIGQADLSLRFRAPWGAEIIPYDWACIYMDHDRSHARDVRETRLPKSWRLRKS